MIEDMPPQAGDLDRIDQAGLSTPKVDKALIEQRLREAQRIAEAEPPR
jgi:hypothetical protein